MNYSPYKILKIKKTATVEEITKAFRSQSMRHHPDRGGNAEEFQRVRKAYAQLSDPHVKKVGDETGRWDDMTPNNAQVQIIGLLSSVFVGVMSGLLQNNRNPTHENIVSLMKDRLKRDTQTVKDQNQKAAEIIAHLKKIQGRFSTTQEVNVMEQIVAGQIAGQETQLNNNDVLLKTYTEGITFLEAYGFKMDGWGISSSFTAQLKFITTS